MIKVGLVTVGETDRHKLRGIGTHTLQLIKSLNDSRKVKLSLVSRSNNYSSHDLVHYQSFNPYMLSIPFFKKTKTMLTIHDLIPLIYPKAYPPGPRGRIIFLFQKFMITKNIDFVITISETSKKDIIRLLNIPSDKIFVTYLASKPVFRKIRKGPWMVEISKKYNLPRKFVLYVGDVNFNKNLITLSKSCIMAKTPLVIVGAKAASKNFDKTHIENKSLRTLQERYIDGKKIIATGFVEDLDLVKIYNLASIYIQPSYYEGFGIPLLDAYNCGVPTIISKTQALVEISGGASVTADPNSSKELAQKIRLLLNDKTLRKKLTGLGRQRAKNFSWTKTARKTIKVYDIAINK